MSSSGGKAVQRTLGSEAREKSGPSAGGEAPRPSKFELPCAGGGPTRLTKSRKLKPFRLAPVATGERGGSIRTRRSLGRAPDFLSIKNFAPASELHSLRGGFSSNTASSIFSSGRVRCDNPRAGHADHRVQSPRARSMTPIGRVFIRPFAATDTGRSFPRRWSLPFNFYESEQYCPTAVGSRLEICFGNWSVPGHRRRDLVDGPHRRTGALEGFSRKIAAAHLARDCS